MAALFTIARTWKQPRFPSADEWIRLLWYIYTMEYYSAIKKNAFESVLTRWMKEIKWKVKSLSHVQLFATLWTVAYQAPPDHGILQARILEWVAISFSRRSSQPRDQTRASRIGGRCFKLWVTREALMRWMEQEPIIQSEVSQKEKHQYSILTHIYGI